LKELIKMHKTKILLCGCLGRMGKAVCELAEQSTEFEIVAGTDTLYATTLNPSFPINSDLEGFQTPFDVSICFLPPTAEDDIIYLIKLSIKTKKPVVICTTGLSERLVSAIDEASKNIPIMLSPNMSLGINLLTNVLNRMSKLLHESGFDIEIVEKHHNKKLDAPSGTAYLLADAINSPLEDKMNYVTNRSACKKERDKNEIGLSAIRGGNIIGEHSVIFAGANEVIELTHIIQSRDVFAEGALKAAKFLVGKTAGNFTMDDLINT